MTKWPEELRTQCEEIEARKATEERTKQLFAEFGKKVAKLEADRRQLYEALLTIQYALGDERPNGVPGWKPMRDWLNARGIFNDDLNDDRVIKAVVDEAIRIYESRGTHNKPATE